MQFLTAYTRVLENLGRSTDAALVDRAKEWVNNARFNIAREIKWWETQATSTIPTVSGTQVYLFPTNMIHLKNIKINGLRINKVENDYLDQIQPEISLDDDLAYSQTGIPNFYMDNGLSFSLYPIPNEVFTITVTYFGLTTITLDATEDYFLLNFPNAVIFRACMEGASYLEDTTMSAKYEELFGKEIHALLKQNVKRRLTDRISRIKFPGDFGTITYKKLSNDYKVSS